MITTANQSNLIDTYNRISIYTGFQLWKVGTTAYLQIAFHNTTDLLEAFTLIQLPVTFKPTADVPLYDLSNDMRYKLGAADGVIRATKTTAAMTVTRIIVVYQCAQ